MTTTVVAMFDRRNQAEKAFEDLLDAGFEQGSIELVAHDADQTQDRPAGFWKNLFNPGAPEDDIGHLAEGVRRGGSLVTVTVTENRVDDVEAILSRHNPVDVDERVERWREEGYSGYDREAPAYSTTQVEAERERYAIPIVEEDIKIGKREVREGGKRIRTYVRETPVEEQVTLRDEEVHVERRPVNRAATEADFQEQNIEMSESHEEAVVSKEARVVEEVTVEKEAVEHTETVRGTERRTEVEVEDVDNNKTRR